MGHDFGYNIVGSVPVSGPVRLWDCGVTWADLEPAPNVFVWDRLDSFINTIGKRRIVLVLGHPAAWAARGGPDGKQAPWLAPGANRPPVSWDIWERYVKYVAYRYAGRVSHYQVWNEPVDDHFYSGSYGVLAEAVVRAQRVVRKVDPKARIISPPLQPRKQARWGTKGRRLFNALVKVDEPFDVWAAHVYPQIGEGVSGWERDMLKVMQRVRKVSRKPVWVTETNFNLGGPGNPWPEVKQERVRVGVARVAERLGVNEVFWYAYEYPNPGLLAIQ